MLVATDFGLPLLKSAYRVQKLWSGLIERCESSSAPLIFLIPWPHDSWLEATLGPYPYLIPWTPETSATLIKSLVGTGHSAGS